MENGNTMVLGKNKVLFGNGIQKYVRNHVFIFFWMVTYFKEEIFFIRSFVFYNYAAGSYRLCNTESKFKTNTYYSKKDAIHIGGSDETHENFIYLMLYIAPHKCNSTSGEVRCISRLREIQQLRKIERAFCE